MMRAASPEAIFSEASEIDDLKARHAMLERACAGDPELRTRVEELLEAASEADSFFSQCLTAVSTLADKEDIDHGEIAVADPDIQETLGNLIGPYRVLEVIGEGGCGVVYAAEQEAPVRRRVALKVMRSGMDTKSVISRFEAEQQALAIMDHPNIARVFDAGATTKGRPYFAMELVDGVRITTYCDQQRLDIRQRLTLFIKVCHAVDHAHQKGVIHRDIKPSNILVTTIDEAPVPKVIDFGIAKAISGRLTEATSLTAAHQMIGTPAYMSPEQASRGIMDSDTRSDVYSLGALLYELLTSQTPFDSKKLLESGLDELQRTLREVEPTRPSRFVAASPAEELARTVRCRRTDLAKLCSVLRSDLDWVVMKALEKDPGRRYQSAAGLALDLQHYLDDEPVAARPLSRVYLLKKLIRRYRMRFAAAAVLVLMLTVCSALATWLTLSMRDEQRRAVAAEQQTERLQREATRMRQAFENEQKFLDVVRMVREGDLQGADQLLNEVRIPKLDPQFIPVYQTLGDSDVKEGNWQKAIDRFRVLFQINEAAHVDSNLEHLWGDTRYAVALVFLERLEEYERFRNALIARIPSTTNPDVAQEVVKVCLLAPANAEMMETLKDFADVIARSLDKSRNVQLPPNMMAAFYCYSLALHAYRGGDYPAAIQWCERAGAFDQGIESRDNGIRLIQALALTKSGKPEEGQTLFESSRTVIEGNFRLSRETQRWNGFWFDQVYAQLLLREANTVFPSASEASQ